jgi:hypothetical protein
MDINNLIVILSIIAIILIIYRILLSTEDFDQNEICDYNSLEPSDFCKSIQKGCTDLINENNNLNNNIDTNCTTLPTDTKDMIDTAITCSDTVNKVIMNNYVQKEVCSQIKNFPPASTIINESYSNIVEDNSSTYKPLDYNNQDKMFLNGGKRFAPF